VKKNYNLDKLSSAELSSAEHEIQNCNKQIISMSSQIVNEIRFSLASMASFQKRQFFELAIKYNKYEYLTFLKWIKKM